MTGRRRVLADAADLVVGGTQVLVVSVTAPVGRKRYNRWGASDAEVTRSMPGDALVAGPELGYTRAISINAAPERVWPWLVQIGQGRAGLYSFDGLENLVGCRIRSVDSLLAEHQQLAGGDLIRMGPAGYPCFRVSLVEPPTQLVLVGADPKPPHDVPAQDGPAGLATWQWDLRPMAGGRATRLVVRQRLTYPSSHGASALWHVVEPIAFVMERRMLLGIKQRAEGQAIP